MSTIAGEPLEATLTKTHRQRIPELRGAIEDLSEGRTTEGFDKLDKFGVIQEIGRREPPGSGRREAN